MTEKKLNPEDLTDSEFITAFEDMTLDPLLFNHAAHVRLAWAYLAKFGLLETIEKYTWGLKKLTVFYGQAGKYHETISWFYMVIIIERMWLDQSANFVKFTADNPDLFDGNSGVMQKYYPGTILSSDTACQVFLLPHNDDLHPA